MASGSIEGWMEAACIYSEKTPEFLSPKLAYWSFCQLGVSAENDKAVKLSHWQDSSCLLWLQLSKLW